ncbi:arylsulfatase [Verrucomicrobiaceae bacterium N1E253]|uniref:Arylsulfatase n=1 Tax=Oceaniferula marina TaxID=2748318 RepID=A0A851GH70_9BACT|nr:arylsulfatase [Oceaniferula marina]NWK56232.1 arylsulfatase [Oceaniferula marina]
MKTILITLLLLPALIHAQTSTTEKPNIILILADDVGYGDLGCYGASKIKTPNLDQLAKQGVRMIDGYASAAVCTPTRFAMLTGKYAWRQRGTGILPGDAGLSIKPGTVTLPGLMRNAGYTTAVVGKWHLGLGTGKTKYQGEIKPGPLEIGFDHCFIFPATNDRVPTIYIEDHHIVGEDPDDPILVNYRKQVGNEPTGRKNPEQLDLKVRRHPDHHEGTIVHGVSRIGYMSGNQKARWKDADLTETFTRKAISFIEENKDKPFFLYVASHTAHEPCVPNKRFKGSSQAGARGDTIQELDWQVGQIMTALDRLDLSDNTLVIFSSDNGSDWPVKRFAYLYEDEAIMSEHKANAPLRAGKGDPYEGATRVPFIARWPKAIKAGSESKEVVCLVDMQATLAAITGTALPKHAGPDSFNMLPAFLGQGKGRSHLVLQHNRGHGNLVIRKGDWKLNPRNNGKHELYHLGRDISETSNVADQHPEVVKEMLNLLSNIKKSKETRYMTSSSDISG